MSAHTPGPWIVDDRHVHTTKDLTYPQGIEPETDVIVMVDTDCHKNEILNDIDRANLQLIAAAPTMLEALEAVRNGWSGNLSEAIGKVNAAIAKARGAA